MMSCPVFGHTLRIHTLRIQASLSYTNLIRGLLASKKRGNLTECGVTAAIFRDAVHPSRLGQVCGGDEGAGE